MNNKALVILSVVLGIVFFAVGYVYVSHPAGQLPGFFPGFQAGATGVHIKHGLATFVVGIACFIFAWFKSAPNKAI